MQRLEQTVDSEVPRMEKWQGSSNVSSNGVLIIPEISTTYDCSSLDVNTVVKEGEGKSFACAESGAEKIQWFKSAHQATCA